MEVIEKLSPEKRKYLSIQWLLKGNQEIPIFYFCPIGCEHDWKNYQLVQYDKNVKTFMFPDKIHAATVYPFNFPDVLSKSNQEMEELALRYEGRIINKNEFYLRTVSLRGLLFIINHIIHTRFSIKSLKKKWETV